MHSFKVICFLIILVNSLTASAAKIHYQLQGDYTLPGKSDSMAYVLEWVEEDKVIHGMYHEEKNIDKKMLAVGQLNNFERFFKINLKDHQYKTLILITTSIKGAQTASIPVKLIFRNDQHVNVETSSRATFSGLPEIKMN